MAERLHLRVERDWGTVHLIGIANWSSAPAAKRLDLAEFGLEPSGRYHVVDQWSGTYLGIVGQGGVDVGVLPPHAVRLLSVREVLGRPQVVGTTGHLLGDVMDVDRVEWDAARGRLSVWPVPLNRSNSPSPLRSTSPRALLPLPSEIEGRGLGVGSRSRPGWRDEDHAELLIADALGGLRRVTFQRGVPVTLAGWA
jgi:hypothetical protein